ncbi:hypothetical protein NUW58_g10709 [Xylaria curta]|uniref:Uncharacterized protein n=1 Tax=Xylaria curta TaxID=42375 RepID=A0ACC1MH23_9PEZI|nr:hypothetical protein NUW58_g10709 [Xylaria curta]
MSRCTSVLTAHATAPRLTIKLPQASITPLLPAPIKGLFILFAIGYQMHNLPRDIGENVRAHARSAVAFWTYQVVRALNEDIAVESTRASDGTMTGVLMLMLADQLQPSTRWRSHYDGLMMMTRLRGGVEKLWHSSPHMRNGILTWIVGEVFANTTSPSHDQLTEITHPKNFKFLEMAWGESVTPVYIGSICPPALFVDVIRINHLRALATRGIAASPSFSSSSSSSSSEDDDAPVYTDAADAPEPHPRLLSSRLRRRPRRRIRRRAVLHTRAATRSAPP